MKSDLDPPPSSSASGSEKTSRWTQQDDLVLIEGLSQQKSLGQNHDSIWSADAWTAVADLLKGSEHISGGAQKTVQQCKARWQRLKIEYRMVKHLRSQPFFSWDEQTHMVTGSSADWDAYIAEHKDAQPWRKKSFPGYDKVRLLVEEANGKEDSSHRWNARSYEQIVPLEPVSGGQQIVTPAVLAPMMLERHHSMTGSTVLNGHIPPSHEPTLMIDEHVLQSNGKRKSNELRASAKRSRPQAPLHVISPTSTPAPTIPPAPPELNNLPISPMPPSRLAAAIQIAEQTEGLADMDFVKVVQLFQRNQDKADAYLAIKNLRTRSMYLRAELEEFNNRITPG